MKKIIIAGIMALIGLSMAIDVVHAEALDKQLAMEDGSEAFAFFMKATEKEVTETVVEIDGEGTDVVDTVEVEEE